MNSEPIVTFKKKAHTIPKSLGGQNYNQNICDSCNEYFGNRQYKYYSIETALKETFNVTRYRLMLAGGAKKKVGEFKSLFFELKEKNNSYRINIKSSFRFDNCFQNELCRAFKRGLYKLYFEELNRQKKVGFENNFDVVRNFSRYDESDLPVYYFVRSLGVFFLQNQEAETPMLFFERMDYLYSNERYTEIEFLGHVFGFPIANCDEKELQSHLKNSIELKKQFFKGCIEIKRLTDIDLTLAIMNG